MKKRVLSVLLCIIVIFSALTVSSDALSYSEVQSKSIVRSQTISKISDWVAKTYFRLVFGNHSFYNNQWQSVKTISKVNNNIYTMNYSYDYNIDDLLERGTDSIADLLIYCSKHLAGNRITFDTEIAEAGCSGFTCFDAEGNHLMGRNFDYKDAPCFIVWTSPANGYKSVSMVDSNMMLYGDLLRPSVINRMRSLIAPYIPLDGVNEMGLSVGVLQVKSEGTNQDTGKTDIITTVAIRAMLDKAANVEEAIALLEQFDMHDMLSSCNYHYILSDREGRSCIVEYIDNEMHVVDSDITTNFFLTETSVPSTPEGQVRYEMISNRLQESNQTLDTVEAMQLLNAVHLNYKHKKYPWRVTTLWSAVYNNNDSSLTLCARMNYDCMYYVSATVPDKVYLSDGSAVIDNYVQAPN